MYETSAVWTITGPDGTTLRFNDGLSGLYLDPAITAGFDSPNVRQNISDLPEYDGAIAGNAYLSSRPVTLGGTIVASSAAARNNMVVTMQRALRGLRGDVVLKSQPQGLPAMQCSARLDNFRVTGTFVKTFQIQLVCPDPRFYSQTLNVQTAAAGAVTIPGASFPWAFPVSWGGGSGASVSLNVTNAGNFDTLPVVRVYGPASSPQVMNVATGQSVYVDVTLSAGQYVDLDFNARTAVRNDGTNVYANVRFPSSSWFTLGPGSTSLQLFAGGVTSSTALDVWWRDSWA